MNSSSQILQLKNCRILRDHNIIKEDLWIRDGKILDPEKVFFDEKNLASLQIDCNNALISPGYIDLQINGGFGTDFSYNTDDVEKGLLKVAQGILAHGVTSFCPTLVTSPPDVYSRVLPFLYRRAGGAHGANVLGAHVEGPFINVEKKGAHPAECILPLDKGIKSVMSTYGSVDNVRIITLAPELPNTEDVIKKLIQKEITVSLGHSMANLNEGEAAVHHGATFITHLFNAMLPFHHRDPGLVGLLASNSLSGRTVYFGIISDGVHTHPAALRIAHRTHSSGLVLVTDAISAMGLHEGTHHVGQMAVEISQGMAFVAGTKTLCGSIATMDKCVQTFKESACCSVVEALEAASLHPAQAIGLAGQKGTLDYGADADLVLLGEDLEVWSTWIAGKCVYQKPGKPDTKAKWLING